VASVYVTNGREVGSEWFEQKLAFLDALAARAAAERGSPLVIGGDFNVAREDRDVYDPSAFAGATHVTSAERTRLERIISEEVSSTPTASCIRRRSSTRGGTTARGISTAAWGCESTTCCSAARSRGTCAECGIERDYRKARSPPTTRRSWPCSAATERGRRAHPVGRLPSGRLPRVRDDLAYFCRRQRGCGRAGHVRLLKRQRVDHAGLLECALHHRRPRYQREVEAPPAAVPATEHDHRHPDRVDVRQLA